MKVKKANILILLLLLLTLTGCAGILSRTVYYYAPISENGVKKDGYDFRHVVSVTRDGPPSQISFLYPEMELEIEIKNGRIIPFFLGPWFFPVLPVFYITPFLPHQAISEKRPLEIDLHFRRISSKVTIVPKEINVVFPNSNIKTNPKNAKFCWNPDKNINVNKAIEIYPATLEDHFIFFYYEYKGKKEPHSFNVYIDGIYVDEKQVNIPAIKFNLEKDFVIDFIVAG